MYKNCQTEYSAARQRTVEEQLLKELEQRHYEDISVSDLCKSTGISRKSFYRYFSGKQGVLEALLDHTVLKIDAALSDNIFLDHTAGLALFFHFWQQQRPFLDTLNRSELLGALVDRSVAVSLDVYAAHHQSDQAPASPPELLVFGLYSSDQRVISREQMYAIEFLVSGLMRVMLHWYWDGFPLTPEQMAAATMTLFPIG